MLTLVRNFLKEEDGMGTVEIVVIIAVLLGIALIFRRQIFNFVDQVFVRIFDSASDVTRQPTLEETTVQNSKTLK